VIKIPTAATCHAERSSEESEAILTAESKHPYLHEAHGGAGILTWSKCSEGPAGPFGRIEFLGLRLHFTSRYSGNVWLPKDEQSVISRAASSFDEMKFVNYDRRLFGIGTESPLTNVRQGVRC